MKNDKFFTQENCDRCRNKIGSTRIMSWFTEECLCHDCSNKEDDLKRELRKNGIDYSELEGCGYVPAPINSIDFIAKK